jgi:propionyl-CoA synthetase
MAAKRAKRKAKKAPVRKKAARKPAVKKTAAKRKATRKRASRRVAAKRRAAGKRRPAARARRKPATGRKATPKRSAHKSTARKVAVPKRKAAKRAAPKRPAPRLEVRRAEAPQKTAMLEAAIAGKPREGERVTEKLQGYAEVHARSLTDPEGFWAEAAADLDWIARWDKVLDDRHPPFYRWFRGGVLNTCDNALDRHIREGRGDQTALIYDSPVTNTIRRYSFRALRDEVARFAGALVDQGVVKGDRVIIYMPMVPEAVIAMLASARIGAIHSVVFGGFAANELATRIDDAKPKVIVSASCGIEVNRVIAYKPLLDAAIWLATHKPRRVLVLQRPMGRAELIAGRDLDWEKAVARAKPADCVPVQATDPLYILYTSGTTGEPKGIVRDNGGHAVALNWTMKNIYGMAPGEVYWAASDVGWVVGHSYIVYAPLLYGCTTVLYEGKPVGTPDAGAFWRVIAEHKVRALFTAPTAFRAIRRDDPDGKLIGQYDLSQFRTLFLAGERLDPPTLEWAERHLKVPVIDHWWQTETGWPIAANCVGIEKLPVRPGSPTKPVPGWDVRVIGENGQEQKPSQIGAIVCKLPLPPGTLPTLWNADARYQRAYLTAFPGCYQTGDAGYIDADGYVYVMARTDDVINVAGHRLSTGAMEEVLAAHPDVAECAVIGVADEMKGQVPLGFLVLKAGVTRGHPEIVREVVQLVRDRIGPVAAFKTATVVKRLPKTRSGKILRGTMQKIADGAAYKTPATIDDPAILPEIADALAGVGYARTSAASSL